MVSPRTLPALQRRRYVPGGQATHQWEAKSGCSLRLRQELYRLRVASEGNTPSDPAKGFGPFPARLPAARPCERSALLSSLSLSTSTRFPYLPKTCPLPPPRRSLARARCVCGCAVTCPTPSRSAADALAGLPSRRHQPINLKVLLLRRQRGSF